MILAGRRDASATDFLDALRGRNMDNASLCYFLNVLLQGIGP
jgi:hypothetical protein